MHKDKVSGSNADFDVQFCAVTTLYIQGILIMEISFITLMKALIGGAGAGFALTGGLSFLVPTLTVTASLALTFAAIGGALIAGVYLRQVLVN